MGRLERAALLEDWLHRGSGVGDHALEPVLSKYPPEIQELCGQLRRVIFELVPEAVEKPYPGWRTIGYSISGGMKSQFCALGPMKTYVNLYLPQGADLDDPDHILEGAGKKMRHIKIRRLEDARREPVTAMIRQAAERCKP